MPPRKAPNRVVLAGGYILAVIIGICLACLFLRLLSTHIDFQHPTDAQRAMMQFGCIAFGILSFYSFFVGLSKCRNSERQEGCRTNKIANSSSPRAFCQVHKPVVTQYNRNDKTRDPKNYPACILKKLSHCLPPLGLYDRIIRHMCIIAKSALLKQPRLYLTKTIIPMKPKSALVMGGKPMPKPRHPKRKPKELRQKAYTQIAVTSPRAAYADKKGERLARKPHRGWRRIY